MTFSVRELSRDDWTAVCAIYEAGLAAGNATFETAAPSWERWDVTHLDGHRLVAAGSDAEVVGWAALAPVSDRSAYAGVAENSVYVRPDHGRRGIGRLLLDTLIHRAEGAGIWTIQTSIFPENAASVALHRRCGFRVVGRRERIGRLNGRWRDTLLVERRSTIVA